jgi:hypothetical protein
MPRGLSSDILTALSSSVIYPAYFVSIQFVNETVYIWTGLGSIVWNSQTWLGAGSLLSISSIEEPNNAAAKAVLLKVSGIDPVFLPEALNQVILGRPVLVYMGLFSSDTFSIGTLIDSAPIATWAGRLDLPRFGVGATEVTLELSCESRLLDMDLSIERRYTTEDLQLNTPGDLGCSFVTSLQQKTLFWGQPLRDNSI